MFVGASGKDAVVSDAEILVVTAKPVRAGATAELELSAVFLHGRRRARARADRCVSHHLVQ
jgi:hypothetical protein